VIAERLVDGSQDLPRLKVDDFFPVAVALPIDDTQEPAPEACLSMQVFSTDFFVDGLPETRTLVLQPNLFSEGNSLSDFNVEDACR
jgi:hypothetical protein